ncbi:GntR family transcriptional regulator [Cryobacterium sp. Y11]|uniref:GntR family transcriptional regulator n=1 Tax=Cryobacterium sp. Y11 TaxID=2045016 RepID=UPI000CE42394|nr:GntR family transcriptional regulator [Cryobacterium sp. Y11]
MSGVYPLTPSVSASGQVSQTHDGNSSTRIAEFIRNAILSGEYRPGARIRQEDVAQRFGASRIPVREALRTLKADGLVTLVANAGAWVSRMTPAECSEVYETRERVEPLLLRYAMPGLDAVAIDHLDELAEQMRRTHDVEEFLRLDREFHLGSYTTARTTVLGDLVNRLWNTTQHYRRAFTLLLEEHSARVVHDEHHLLVTAIRDGDTDGAEAVLSGHIRRTRLALARHPEVFDQ